MKNLDISFTGFWLRGTCVYDFLAGQVCSAGAFAGCPLQSIYAALDFCR